MTYCVGLYLDEGLVMLSDTRTNAGFDNISTFSKMQTFEVPGDRVIMLLCAGNLAVTQAVVNSLTEGVENPETHEIETIYTVPTMFKAAELVGRCVVKVRGIVGETMQQQGIRFDASFLLGGQLKGRTLRLYQIYAAGNFIAATSDTPYLQIGEHKYGKPILDRVARHDIALTDGVKLVLVSMDSTLRSNLSVGMPIDLAIYTRDSLTLGVNQRLTEDDPYFRMIRQRWSQALRDAYRVIPDPSFGGDGLRFVDNPATQDSVIVPKTAAG